MSTISGSIQPARRTGTGASAALASAMTRAASRQSWYTIRFLVDRGRVDDAWRAYAYFRWVDDRIDEGEGDAAARADFLRRQQALVEAAYRAASCGRPMPADLGPEEQLLADLIAGDTEVDSGLQTYLRNMMAVLAFDVERRGRLISAAELDRYIDLLAAGVTAALFHFIGHDCPVAPSAERARAVGGACVIHQLRDLIEDCANGYVNIPAEYLATHGITPGDVAHPAMRRWVTGRVALARDCFREGRAFIARLGNARRRLAGRAYIARFEYMANIIERDGYLLRAAYPERKTPRAVLWVASRAFI